MTDTAADWPPKGVDTHEAPTGYYAVEKRLAAPADGGNVCKACDWRPTCQLSDTDFRRPAHRCMPGRIACEDGSFVARQDGCSVVFKADRRQEVFDFGPENSRK